MVLIDLSTDTAIPCPDMTKEFPDRMAHNLRRAQGKLALGKVRLGGQKTGERVVTVEDVYRGGYGIRHWIEINTSLGQGDPGPLKRGLLVDRRQGDKRARGMRWGDCATVYMC